MATIRIFISYRRDTDGARATLVAKAIEGGSMEGGFLSGNEATAVQIYMDVQDRLGVKWPERIQEELAAADVVIAVIGPEWLSAKDRYYQRRIDQEDDWVRREIEAALKADSVLVPILFDATEMPPSTALPKSISSLAERQGLPVRTSSFDSDIQPLFRELLELTALKSDRTYTRLNRDYAETRWPYPDPPLPVRPAQLSDQDLEVALREMIPEWVRSESSLPQDESKRRVELHRELRFGSFMETIQFMSEVGRFCDEANHHPRWENIYRTLWIYLSTWDIGHRISQLDLTLAAHIDKVFLRYQRP